MLVANATPDENISTSDCIDTNINKKIQKVTRVVEI